MRTDLLASIAYHMLLILGDIGVVCTAFVGVRGWTETAMVFLLLAGGLTFVYPHVGTDPRYERRTWGESRRSLVPWLNLLLLLVIWVLRLFR